MAVHSELAPSAGSCSATPAELESHRRIIASYLRGRVRTQDDCEDLVQTVFLRATSRLASFRGDCPMSHWLLRIALNELKLYYARTLPKSERNVSLSDFQENFEPPAQQIEGLEHPNSQAEETAGRLLRAARAACTSAEFKVMAMFYRGESFENMAQLLDMRSGTVRSHFLRGRANLLAYVFDHELDLVGGNQVIKEASSKAAIAEDAGERLTKAEKESMQIAKRGKQFRAACLKIAKFLPSPAAQVLALLEVLLWIRVEI